MIESTLKSLGYKESRNDDLSNKEFKCISVTKTYNKEFSTLGTDVYSTDAVFQVFIHEKNVQENILGKIASAIVDDISLSSVDVTSEKEENGEMFTINVRKEMS